VYKLLLILKYLRKRRIAWWALFAVALCTMMVLVVISVMGGWLTMARTSFRGLSGDLLIQGDSLYGFPNYQELISKLKEEPKVAAAVPLIRTFGLINIANLKPSTVQVMGVPIDQIGDVNQFPGSLYRQHQFRIDAASDANNAKLSASEREDAARDAATTQPAASFELIRGTTSTTHVQLPESAKFLGDFVISPVNRLSYDPSTATLTFTGRMDVQLRDALIKLSTEAGFKGWVSTQILTGHVTAADADALLKLSDDPNWPAAIRALYATAVEDAIDYADLMPKNPRAVKWPGMIGGSGVLEIRKDKDGKTIGRSRSLYTLPVKMTVLSIAPGEFDVGDNNISSDYFWIVDDSHTKVWQYDTNYVYVPFDKLQRDLRMDAQTFQNAGGQDVIEPARCTEVDVKLMPGADLYAMKDAVQKVVDRVWASMPPGVGASQYIREPSVQTWEESQALWLGAIENEKSLVTFLFGIVSIVAIFLIFCIFYMIVMEKTRDIGIIKSIGATSSGIAVIFLGYGLVIGIVGSCVGWLAAYGVVHNINEIHTWMSHKMGITIWDPRVYAFDTIPSMMATETPIILFIAIASSVLGALLPAVRAARMNPIEAIRWE
jgi:lipoprotein-releasing system permease protein